MIYYVVLILALISLTACDDAQVEEVIGADPVSGSPPSQKPNLAGEVLETVDAAGYTYVLIETDRGQAWLAGPRTVVSVGDSVTAPDGMFMGTYHSSSLDRDFENLFFVNAISKRGAKSPEPVIEKPPSIASVSTDEIEPLEGAVSIASVYEDREQLAGRAVIVKGKVVKVNRGIMGRNWIHLQDGTGDAGSGTKDLTVTTDDVAALGDIVVVSGMVTLNKDFGAGYSYDVIVEQASVSPE